MTYPGTQQPGIGTDVTAEPAEQDTPGGVDDPAQDERSPGNSHATGPDGADDPEGHPS